MILGGADQLQEYENLSSIPNKNTLVAPPSTLNFELLQKMIQASYGINFFPVKAEMLIFWILMTGGPRGDLQSVNLSLKMQILTEDVTTVHVKLHISSKTDLGTPWHLLETKVTLWKSPHSPSVIRSETIACQFSLEKKIMS